MPVEAGLGLGRRTPRPPHSPQPHPCSVQAQLGAMRARHPARAWPLAAVALGWYGGGIDTLPASVRRRETRWRERCASANPARFTQRLAADDLTVDDVPRLLDSTGVWMSDASTTRHSWCELAPTETMHAGNTRQTTMRIRTDRLHRFRDFLPCLLQLARRQTQLSQHLDRPRPHRSAVRRNTSCNSPHPTREHVRGTCGQGARARAECHAPA